MAVTITKKGVSTVPGDGVFVKQTVALDSSYPNPAGYVFTPASFGLQRLRRIVNVEPTSLPSAATWTYWIVFTYDSDGFITSFALHLAVVATGVEAANALNVSTATYEFNVEGN